MGDPQPGWTDERLEKIMAAVLKAGVVLAGLLVFSGGILYLAKYGMVLREENREENRALRGEAPTIAENPKFFRFSGIITEALAGRSRAIIQLGVLVLIATPISLVALAVIGFALQRDRIYVVISGIVLGVLIYSLVG
jgi:uncharacterized membrane protein